MFWESIRSNNKWHLGPGPGAYLLSTATPDQGLLCLVRKCRRHIARDNQPGSEDVPLGTWHLPEHRAASQRFLWNTQTFDRWTNSKIALSFLVSASICLNQKAPWVLLYNAMQGIVTLFKPYLTHDQSRLCLCTSWLQLQHIAVNLCSLPAKPMGLQGQSLS